MIRIMKIEDLKNTKIYLSNIKERMLFQEKAFKLGVKWRDGAVEIKHVKDAFYYIDGDFQMTVDGGIGGVTWFLRKRNRQIFLDDVLAIEEPKEECEFKPFDKVLVRDYIDIGKWMPRLFAEYDGAARYGKYETTDGNCYNFCIPYEGNEHLVELI